MNISIEALAQISYAVLLGLLALENRRLWARIARHDADIKSIKMLEVAIMKQTGMVKMTDDGAFRFTLNEPKATT